MIADKRRVWSLHGGFFWVLLLAGLLRVIYLWQYQSLPDWDILTVDNNYHHHWAQSIADGNILGDTTYFRAPFYAFSLALLYTVFGASIWVGRLFGLLIGLSSVVMTYLLGRKLFDRKTGVIAAALHAVYPMAIYFEPELLLDPLFTLLMQITIYRMLIWLEERTFRNAFITGVLLGLSAITRPTILVIVPLSAVAILYYRSRIGRPLRQFSAFVSGAVIIIGAITLRNLLIASDPVLISAQGGINLYIGNNEKADGVSAILPEPMGFNWRMEDIKHIAEIDMGRSLKPGEVSSYWTSRTINWIKENPGEFSMLSLEKIYRNISNKEISNNRELDHFRQQLWILAYNPLNFGVLFILTAVCAAGRGLRDRKSTLLLALILVYILAVALFFFSSRFRLPLVPYYCVLGAAGLWELYRRIRHNETGLWRLLTVGGVAGLITYLPLAPLPAGSSTHAMTAAGLYHYAQDDFETALRYHQRAYEIDSTFPEVNLNLGVTYLRLGELEPARHFFKQEIRLHPNRTNAYTNLASLHLLEEDFEAAVELSRHALDQKPYRIVPNAVLLRGLFAVDTVSESVLWRETLAAAARTNNDVYLMNDAGILLSNKEMYDRAEQILLRGLAADPPPIETDDEAFRHDFRNSSDNVREQKAKVAYQLGYISGLTEQYGKSIRYSRQAIELDPTLAAAYLNLVNGYLSVNQSQAADSVLTIAERLFPNSRYVKEFRERLR